MEPTLCGSAGCVVRRYLRLRPLCGLCLRLTLGLAATRLPGAMRLPRRDTAPVSPETMQQHTHAFIHYIRRSRVAAILSARLVQYGGNGLWNLLFHVFKTMYRTVHNCWVKSGNFICNATLFFALKKTTEYATPGPIKLKACFQGVFLRYWHVFSSKFINFALYKQHVDKGYNTL